MTLVWPVSATHFSFFPPYSVPSGTYFRASGAVLMEVRCSPRTGLHSGQGKACIFQGQPEDYASLSGTCQGVACLGLCAQCETCWVLLFGKLFSGVISLLSAGENNPHFARIFQCFFEKVPLFCKDLLYWRVPCRGIFSRAVGTWGRGVP